VSAPVDDRGLLLGDGLFETILYEVGKLHHFGGHADRMIRGCVVLGLPAPDAQVLEIVAMDAVQAAGLADRRAAVRLTWTAGSGGRGLDRPDAPHPRLIASAAPSPRPTTPASLVTVSIRRNEGSPASRIKSLNYLDNVLARRTARQAGADEALMLNNRGEIAGAAVANLFWFEGDALLTPSLECGVLDGIMRGLIIAEARRVGIQVTEIAAFPERLAGARGMFLTNSLIGVRAVESLDGMIMDTHRMSALLSSPT
jgi:branched-chain amino acid aminotransferase/4-amino-4-deoxychorismate lyase